MNVVVAFDLGILNYWCLFWKYVCDNNSNIKLLVSILEMYVITILTSHVKLYFRRADLMLISSFINLVLTGC